MLNKKQIQLVQMAAKGAGLRGGKYQSDGRYKLLLAQYKQPNGKPVESCKQLTRDNLEDFLAVCESLGWVHPKHGPNYYQKHIMTYHRGPGEGMASFGTREAIKCLAGDLGMNAEHLKKFIKRMSHDTYDSPTLLSSYYAWKIIEALKAMLSRRDGVNYETLNDVKAAYATTECTE